MQLNKKKNYACWRRAYRYQTGSKLQKIVCMKNIFENGWWEDAYPSSYPLDPPLAISYEKYQKSLAYFRHLAPIVSFLFTKRQSQKGRHGTMPPFLNMLLPRSLRLGACERIINPFKGG